MRAWGCYNIGYFIITPAEGLLKWQHKQPRSIIDTGSGEITLPGKYLGNRLKQLLV